MVAEELINHMIPPLKLTDDAHKAIVWMEEFRCNQLPVTQNTTYLGMISEDMILEGNDIEKKIGEFELIATQIYIGKNTHFFDILKVATENKLQSIAVVDAEKNYQGVITVQDTMTAFAQSSAIQMPGGILVLSMDQRDYSLSRISSLIEENDAKILNTIVKEDENDPNKIKLTLKINTFELNRIVATLERFEYKIIARFQETDVTNTEREKIDMLLRYLEI
ncbi:MAG: CBS domain-containing protein [Cyclobacteriaceae bacterium]|nr:CBS domain-containing protein [Cyclobacteriaceae bacterium]